MIVILDYGLGNIKSISNMLNKLGVENRISSDIGTINNADKYILPGVGSFDIGITKLLSASWFDTLKNNVYEKKKPILGICLGMQLLTNKSAEGKMNGLSWIDAEVVKFDNTNLIVPHMGWNIVTNTKSKLFSGLENNRFYFVHSFYVECKSENIIAEADYGTKFVCSINKNNIYGVQFHPEKSHKFGMKLLKNFSVI